MAAKTPRTTVTDYLQSVGTENEARRSLRRRSAAGDPEAMDTGGAAAQSASQQKRNRMEAAQSPGVRSPRITKNSMRAIAHREEEEVTPRHLLLKWRLERKYYNAQLMPSDTGCIMWLPLMRKERWGWGPLIFEIQSMLTVQGTAQPVTRKRKRASDVVMGPPSSTAMRRAARRRSSISTVDVEDVSRKYTPRTNIVGFLEQAPEETPAARKSSSATDSVSVTQNASSFLVNEVGISLLENRSSSSKVANVSASGGRFRGKKGKLNIPSPQASPARTPQVQQSPDSATRSRTSTPKRDRSAKADNTVHDTTPEVIPPCSPLSEVQEDEQNADNTGRDAVEDVSDISGGDRSRGGERNVFSDVLGGSEGRRTGEGQTLELVERRRSRLEREQVRGGPTARTPSLGNTLTATLDFTPAPGLDSDLGSITRTAPPLRSSVTRMTNKWQDEYNIETAENTETKTVSLHSKSLMKSLHSESQPEGSHSKSNSMRKISVVHSPISCSPTPVKVRSGRETSSHLSPNLSGHEQLSPVSDPTERDDSGKDGDFMDRSRESRGRDGSFANTGHTSRQDDGSFANTGHTSRQDDGSFANTGHKSRQDDGSFANTGHTSRQDDGSFANTGHTSRQDDGSFANTGHKSRQDDGSFANTGHTSRQDDGSFANTGHKSRQDDGSFANTGHKSRQDDGSFANTGHKSRQDDGSFANTGHKSRQDDGSFANTGHTSRQDDGSFANTGHKSRQDDGSFANTGHKSRQDDGSFANTGHKSRQDDGSFANTGFESEDNDGGLMLANQSGSHVSRHEGVRVAGLQSAVRRPSSRSESGELAHSSWRHDSSGPGELLAGEEDCAASSSAHTAAMPDVTQGVSDQEESSGEEEEGYSPLKTPRLPDRPRTPNTVSSKLGARLHRAEDTQDPSEAGPKRKTAASASRRKPRPGLPTSVVKATFSHFCQLRVSKDAIEEVEKMSEHYWKNMAEDLEAFATHANRQTITEADVELMMKRQGFITDKCSLNTLIAKYLPLELRQEMIPIARSGNQLEPKR